MEPVVVPVDDDGRVLCDAASCLCALVGGEFGVDFSGGVGILGDGEAQSHGEHAGNF